MTPSRWYSWARKAETGDDGDDDSRVATALILEGVDDEDVEWRHVDS